MFAGHPEFYGPDGANIKFAIGPIAPMPTVSQQQHNLEYIATKRGEQVIDLGIIHVGGKEHATITIRIPLVGQVKHYSLIYQSTEFFVSARGPEAITDSIVASFHLTSHS